MLKNIFIIFFVIGFTVAEVRLSCAQNITDFEKNISNASLSKFSEKEQSSSIFLNKNTDIFLNRSFKSKISDRNSTTSSTLPIAIGVASFIYLFNPIVLLENDKIGGGLTKEFSVGFGYFGQHRFSTEYSYIFRKDLKSNLRFAYKYDILLERGLKPSNFLQGTPVISIGAGYFTNFTNQGYFPELSYGYSIRNDKLLFFPSMKIRYTYVANGANIVDFSVGLIIGIANPFIDLKIRAADNK